MRTARTSKGGSSGSSVVGLWRNPRSYVSGYDLGSCIHRSAYVIDKNLTGHIGSRAVDSFKFFRGPASMRDLKTAQTAYIACSTRSTTHFKTNSQLRPLWHQSLSSQNRYLRKNSFKSIVSLFIFAMLSALLSGNVA